MADHLVKWLPEFALTLSECAGIDSANAVELIKKAAKTVYTTPKFSKRGEFGELLLHVAIRQVYDSLPAISKLYYKSALNDTVKGFDAVHVVGEPDNLELWIGEVKFYTSISAAIRDVVSELEAHLGMDYLRTEFLLIANKIDDRLPHAAQLRRLISEETSLDEVFRRACIPVMLTYDSDCIAAHKSCTEQYAAEFREELQSHYDAFSSKLAAVSLPSDVRVHLFLLPLGNKTDIVGALDRKLRAWQAL